MKNASIICSLLLLTVLGSCKKNQETKDAEINANEKPVSVACYQAFYESDTIDLKLNTLKNGKINGDMAMKLSTILILIPVPSIVDGVIVVPQDGEK